MIQPIRLGLGKILSNGKGKDMKKGYKGTCPFEQDTKVYIIECSTLEDLLKNALALLHASKIPMTEEIYKKFADNITFTNDDSQEQYNLILDRHFYTPDVTRMIYVRYATIDQYDREHDMNVPKELIKHDTIEEDMRKAGEDFMKKVPEETFSDDEHWFWDGHQWYEVEEDDDEDDLLDDFNNFKRGID